MNTPVKVVNPLVRVNCPNSTPWGSRSSSADPEEAASNRAAKAEDVGLISDVAKDLDDATELWVMVETAKGYRTLTRLLP